MYLSDAKGRRKHQSNPCTLIQDLHPTFVFTTFGEGPDREFSLSSLTIDAFNLHTTGVLHRVDENPYTSSFCFRMQMFSVHFLTGNDPLSIIQVCTLLCLQEFTFLTRYKYVIWVISLFLLT